MKTIGLEYMKKLKKQSSEKELNETAAILGDGMIESPNAAKAKRILENAKVAITLTELRALRTLSTQTEFNDVAAMFGDGKVLTPEAQEAISILDTATVILTLREFRELQELSTQTEFNDVAAMFGDGRTLTAEAQEALSILESAELVITLDEMRELLDASQKTEKLPFALDENTTIPSDDAIKARNILAKAKLSVTTEEKEALIKQSNEKEFNETMALLNGDGMVETSKAREARNLLAFIKSITLSSSEMETLYQQSTETETRKNIFDDIETIYTEQAQIAQATLGNNDLLIALGEEKELIFSVQDVGKGTLNAQKETLKKAEETSILDDFTREIQNNERENL